MNPNYIPVLSQITVSQLLDKWVKPLTTSWQKMCKLAQLTAVYIANSQIMNCMNSYALS